MEIELFQDGGQIKNKKTSFTTMGAKIQAFDIFETPLSSHYPLPLNLYIPLVMVSIEGRKRKLADKTVYQNGSIDTSLDSLRFQKTQRQYL